MGKKTLEELRVEIDALDKKVQALIGDRATLAGEVAEVKKHQMTIVFFTVLSVKHRCLGQLLNVMIAPLKARIWHIFFVK